jgi:putative ABC transport system permease protein
MLLLKLTISSLTARKTRALLTILAVALSVSLVVAVTGGYASARSAARHFLDRYLGPIDVLISKQNDPRGTISEQVGTALAADPRVRGLSARLELQNGLLKDINGKEEAGRVANVTGITQPGDLLADNLELEDGKWFKGDDGDVVVIDQSTAAQLKVSPGGTLVLPNLDRRLTLTVVGIIHKPAIIVEGRPVLYVPLRTLQRFTGLEGRISRVLLALKQGVDVNAFDVEWTPKLEAISPGLRIKSAADAKQQLDRQMAAIDLLSYAGGIVAMLTATFIVFSALSMGVLERQRTLAMLRAVGALRSHVAALVLLEGIMLAGTGALIGVPLGLLWVYGLTIMFENFFVAGVVISWGGILLGVGGSLGAALLASLLPAWSASRVSPLDAMTPQSTAPRARSWIICAVVGAAMVTIDPLIFFGPLPQMIAALGVKDPLARLQAIRFAAHFALGLPMLLSGVFLMSPAMVWAVERVAGRLVAGVFGIRFSMLRQQLSSGIWRAAGTCTALMVGLSTLIVLQVQGNSALSGWQIPDKFPDIFIATNMLGGIPMDAIAKLDNVDGIKQGQVMPVAIATPGLAHGFFGLAEAMIMPDATMFFGVDPDRAFDLMALDFREGNATDAKRMLKEGRHLLVTSEFRTLKGLHVGSKLSLNTDHGPQEYTVAGVIWSPGIDVIVSVYDMGNSMDQRTAASVFGTLGDARRDFGIDRYPMVVANLENGADKGDILKTVQKELKLEGLRAGDVRPLKLQIETEFHKIVLMISTVAFAAMGIASLGVTNTIMASVRSRRWQFGILRSIGVTRSSLLRLVLAEAALLGLIACALGLGAGLLMSIDAHALATTVTGYGPPIVIPWMIVLVGIAAVMIISLLASLGPATQVAFVEPLTLLQAGRSAS